MSKVLELEIPDETYERLEQIAADRGRPAEQIAREWLEQQARAECSLSFDKTVGRRAFLRLPIEERRRLLSAQSEKLVTYYEEHSDWRELETGDFGCDRVLRQRDSLRIPQRDPSG